MFRPPSTSVTVSLGGAISSGSFTTIINQTSGTNSSAFGSGSFQRQAQTFTTNGEYSQIRVSSPIFQRSGTTGGTYQWYIFATSGNVPTGAALFTSSVLNYTDLPSSDPSPNFDTQFLATGLSLSNATEYAIAWYHISGSGSDGANFLVDINNPYSGGNQAFDFSGGGTWTAALTNDMKLLIEGA